MRPTIPLVLLSLPVSALAAATCPAAEPIAHAASDAATAPVFSGPPLSQSEIAASPALARIASHGAVLYRLSTEHGLSAVFARSGEQFRVFYLTPDNQAEIGGVMWDASGQNITRAQVASIPGTIPTVQWNPPASKPEAPAGAPQPSLVRTGVKPASDAIDPVARLEASNYGLEGRDGAPRVYMLIDPLCPYSTRAFSTLQPYVNAGRLQLALVPISINDHENNGASTPAALQLLSAGKRHMGETWEKVSASGHADPSIAPGDTAPAALTLNLAAAHAIRMRGTPTLVWRDRTGAPREEAGLPDSVEQFLQSLPS